MKPFQENRMAMLSWWIAILLIATQIGIAFTQDARGKFLSPFIYASKRINTTCIDAMRNCMTRVISSILNYNRML